MKKSTIEWSRLTDDRSRVFCASLAYVFVAASLLRLSRRVTSRA